GKKTYSDWGRIGDAIAVYDQLISSTYPGDLAMGSSSVLRFWCFEFWYSYYAHHKSVCDELLFDTVTDALKS
ncbi:hypothetical protein A2U01_0006241, partial [Trifolium medium]|nr:hypothetical protein [Trifolium medium]